MKKIVKVVLLCTLALLLSVGAVAAGEDTVKSVTVTCELPAASQNPASAPVTGDNMKIVVQSDGRDKNLKEGTDFQIISSHWEEADQKKKLTSKDSFVSGRSYTLHVSFQFASEEVAKTYSYDSQSFINGKGATLESKTEEGLDGSNKITIFELSATFVCAPQQFAPKVSLTVKGDKNKEYDGKDVTLNAVVEKSSGVDYRFEWYRNGEKIEKADKETLAVKHAKDSGKYHCKVYATLTSDPNETTQSSETPSHEITITPHPVMIQIEDAQKNLFDKDPAFTYTVMGEIFDTLEGSPARDAGEDIGKYAITPGSLNFPEEVRESYTIEFKNGVFTVLNVTDLPFSAVSIHADLSRVVGKKDARIRISASKGALPEGARLSLKLSGDKAKEALAGQVKKDILKCFEITLVSADEKALTLPKHASLKIQIPLTEEEEGQKKDSISAGLYTTSAKMLDTDVVENDGVTYIAIQIKELGSIALYAGDAAAPLTSSAAGEDDTRGGGNLALWIVIIVLSLVAAGAIVFTVVWTRKHDPKAIRKKKEDAAPEKKTRAATPAPEKKKEAEEEDVKIFQKSDEEKIRRIADELNALPPVPETEGMENAPETEEKKPEKQSKVISFEDLED